MQRLKGKVSLITGSSRGIGKAIALAFGREGAKVAVCYNREKEKAEEVVSKIKSFGSESEAFQLTVTDRNSIKAAVKEIYDIFGFIEVLVNNAGINLPNDFDKISDEDWERVLSVNLTGVFKVTQECLHYMNDGGCIINISSVSGQYGGPRTTHYCVSKAGVIALTHNLAIFCAKRNIRVNAIAPGLIESEMANAASTLGVSDRILLKRMGLPEEVARSAVFLASDEASYITAQTINVNGGLYF